MYSSPVGLEVLCQTNSLLVPISSGTFPQLTHQWIRQGSLSCQWVQLLRVPRLLSSKWKGRSVQVYHTGFPQSRSGFSRGAVACSAAAATSVGKENNTREKADALTEWLIANNSLISGKAAAIPAEVPEGIGLIAARKVSGGEEVFLVPESLWLNLQAVRASPVGPFCKGMRPWVQLALLVIHEKGNPQSRWQPYLASLPTVLDVPLFWSEEELADLEGTQLLPSVISYKEHVEAQYKSFLSEVQARNPGLFPLEVFTLDAFRWAYATLRSRTFPPLVQEEIALVPLADLVNHGVGGSAPAKAKWEKRNLGLFNKQQVVAMKAGRSYEPGEQILMDYGPELSNGTLALDYGFAEPGGQRDEFTLTLSISESDRFFDDKEDILQLAGYSSTTQYFDLKPSEGPPEAMLTFLRLSALGGADAFLLEALFRDAAWGHVSVPVSRENEEAICTTMTDGCREALSAYATSLEEDMRLMGEDLSARKRTAVIVRLGEKRVLLETLAWFEGRMAELDRIEYYQERRLRDLGLVDDRGDMTPWIYQD